MPPPANLSPEMIQYAPGAAGAWSGGWSYETAATAARLHRAGSFSASYRLAIDLWSHAPILAARRQVMAACALPYTIDGPERAPGRIEVDAARELWRLIDDLRDEVVDAEAMLGLCVLQHPIVVRETEAGPRHVIEEVDIWPLACVEYVDGSATRERGYYARPKGGAWIKLPDPGKTDGHWTVIGSGKRPHERAAINALDLEYIAGKMGRRALAKLVNTIGRSSPTGNMPPETPMLKADGSGDLTDEAKAALDALQGLGETQAAALFPDGFKLAPFELAAQTAGLWPAWMDLGMRMVSLALRGHDLGISSANVYKNPTDQAIPQDLDRARVGALERASSALFSLLGQLNTPRAGEIRLNGHLPDVDQAERIKAEKEQRKADDEHALARLQAAKAAAEQLAAERAAGAVVDDARFAEVYAVADVPPPAMAEAAPKGDAVYAYDLDGGIVTINEQREGKGLPRVLWGDVTVPEYRARVAAGWTTSPAGWVPPAAIAAPAQIAPAAPATPPAAPPAPAA